MTEYVLIVALISLVAILVMIAYGNVLDNRFNSASTNLSSAGTE